MRNKNQDVVFRRVRGRIVPIRRKASSQVGKHAKKTQKKSDNATKTGLALIGTGFAVVGAGNFISGFSRQKASRSLKKFKDATQSFDIISKTPKESKSGQRSFLNWAQKEFRKQEKSNYRKAIIGKSSSKFFGTIGAGIVGASFVSAGLDKITKADDSSEKIINDITSAALVGASVLAFRKGYGFKNPFKASKVKKIFKGTSKARKPRMKRPTKKAPAKEVQLSFKGI